MNAIKKNIGKGLLLPFFFITVTSSVNHTRGRDPYAALKILSEKKSLSRDFNKLIVSFDTMKSAKAAASGFTQSAVNIIKQYYGLVMGYSADGYLTYVCGGAGNEAEAAAGTCDGPPQDGIVGAITAIVEPLRDAAGDCSALPSSGSASGTQDGVTYELTFSSPTHAIPAAWDGGGTDYDKRISATVTVAQTTTEFAVELSCSSRSDVYFAANMVANEENAPGYERRINGYFGNRTSGGTVLKNYEIAMSEYLPAGSGGPLTRAADLIRVEKNDSTQTYNLWGAITGGFDGSPGKDFISQIYVNADYAGVDAAHQAASIFYRQLTVARGMGHTDSRIDDAALAAVSGHSSSALGTATAFDTHVSLASTANNTKIEKQACVDFSNPDTAPTSNALCSGKTLSSPPTSALGVGFTPDDLMSLGADLEALSL